MTFWETVSKNSLNSSACGKSTWQGFVDSSLHNSGQDPGSTCVMCFPCFYYASYTADLMGNSIVKFKDTYLYNCSGKNDFEHKNFKEILLHT